MLRCTRLSCLRISVCLGFAHMHRIRQSKWQTDEKRRWWNSVRMNMMDTQTHVLRIICSLSLNFWPANVDFVSLRVSTIVCCHVWSAMSTEHTNVSINTSNMSNCVYCIRRQITAALKRTSNFGGFFVWISAQRIASTLSVNTLSTTQSERDTSNSMPIILFSFRISQNCQCRLVCVVSVSLVDRLVCTHTNHSDPLQALFRLSFAFFSSKTVCSSVVYCWCSSCIIRIFSSFVELNFWIDFQYMDTLHPHSSRTHMHSTKHKHISWEASITEWAILIENKKINVDETYFKKLFNCSSSTLSLSLALPLRLPL